MSIEAAFFGALGRDAELKTSKAGKPYLRLAVRVGDDTVTQWVSVVSLDERAIEVADKLVKGAKVYVEGKLSLDTWTGQDGAQRTGLSVLSWHTRLSAIGRNKPKSEGKPKPAPTTTMTSRPAVDPDLDDPLPF